MNCRFSPIIIFEEKLYTHDVVAFVGNEFFLLLVILIKMILN